MKAIKIQGKIHAVKNRGLKYLYFRTYCGKSASIGGHAEFEIEDVEDLSCPECRAKAKC